MATSYNGWPASPDRNEIGVVKFGDAQGFPFPGGVKAGDVFTVLGYVATQLHNRVEPCIGGWCWGYTYKQNVNNPSQLSCHASATAIDWNAPDHPNGSSGTFTAAQVGTIRAILVEVQGAVRWLEGYDEMHFEICVGAGDLARVAASLPAGGPTPPPVTEGDAEMALVIQSNGDPRPHMFLSGDRATQLTSGASTEGLRAAGVPVAQVTPADWDVLWSRYQ